MVNKTAVIEDRAERNRLLGLVRAYVRENDLVPPLSMEELREHTRLILIKENLDADSSNLLMVLISNEVWRDTIAAIPFDRRVLLLPQCLRSSSQCGGEIDEFGLLCEGCGRCPIAGIQDEAEKLGYVVLVAEGTTVVTKLLDGGKVDAVIGVSCMDVLEKSFPHMAADAIPGIAVPLLKDGCVDTSVDVEWVLDAVRLKSDGRWPGRTDLDALRAEVMEWFNMKDLRETMRFADSPTETIALSWLAGHGKRWRPFLAACVFNALRDDDDVPCYMKHAAIAVECFHKASLVHDDIEDDDDFRYGDMTLHKRHGVPVALNVGDLLLGEGYRLIAGGGLSLEQRAAMLSVAAEAHRKLCLGQGMELSWMRNPALLTVDEILNVFLHKTVPAFNVALQFGAIAAGADDVVCEIVKKFSDALGTAYQIKDDLEDFHRDAADSDMHAVRPSLIFALMCEHADEVDGEILVRDWLKRKDSGDVVHLFTRYGIEDKAKQMLAHYRNESVRSLIPLKNAGLKTLLRRVVSRVLGNA